MKTLFEAIQGFFASVIQLGGRPLSVTWGQLLFAFVLPVVGIFLALRLIVFLVRRLVSRSQLKEKTQHIILRWFRIVYRLLFLLAIVLLAANLLGDQIIESLQSVVSFLREPFFTSGNTQVSVITLLLLVPIFYIATWAGNATKKFMETSVLERLSLDASRRFGVASLLRYGIMALVIIIGLSIIGINLSSLAVLFGVLGIGLGFGLQGVVANFFAGLMIILTRPIKEGDRVKIGEFEGDVHQIRILYSVVNTITEETIIVPNRQITDNTVHNQSYQHPRIILYTDVQVAYGSDLDAVKEVLLDVGAGSEFLDKARDPKVLFRSFDDSGITVTLLLPIANVVQRHIARSSVVMEIWRAFKAHGIVIPFPQRDLYVKEMRQTKEDAE